MAPGFVEPDRAIASIKVGRRHRRDMGDLDGLAASIAKHGMLQPITIAPGGFLICGARRLAAAQQLGWSRVRVWVHTAISSELEVLLAEQQENTVRKPLTPTEEASLYAELKDLLAADARRRQQATQYRGQNADGAVPPVPTAPAGSDGDVRVQAALEVTGRKSYTRLEQVRAIEKLANSHRRPAEIRQMAREQLRAIDADGTVEGHYLAVKTAATLAELRALVDDEDQPLPVRRYAGQQHQRLGEAAEDTPPAKVLSMAKSALARCRTADPIRPSETGRQAARRRLDILLRTWNTAADQAGRCEAGDIAASMTRREWKQFQALADRLSVFADDVSAARDGQRESGTPAA